MYCNIANRSSPGKLSFTSFFFHNTTITAEHNLVIPILTDRCFYFFKRRSGVWDKQMLLLIYVASCFPRSLQQVLQPVIGIFFSPNSNTCYWAFKFLTVWVVIYHYLHLILFLFVGLLYLLFSELCLHIFLFIFLLCCWDFLVNL